MAGLAITGGGVGMGARGGLGGGTGATLGIGFGAISAIGSDSWSGWGGVRVGSSPCVSWQGTRRWCVNQPLVVRGAYHGGTLHFQQRGCAANRFWRPPGNRNQR